MTDRASSPVFSADLLTHGDHADDGGGAPDAQHVKGLLGSLCKTNSFDGVVDAVHAQLAHGLNRVHLGSIDKVVAPKVRANADPF